MDTKDLEILESDNIEDIKNVLLSFCEKYATLFNFDEFNKNGQWKLIWDLIFKILKDPNKKLIFPLCLSCIKILTRDKNNIQSHDIQENFEQLNKLTILCLDNNNEWFEITSEALKCLCNIVFLSTDCQKLCLKNSLPEQIMKRVQIEKKFPHDIEYFDMKLLFLITALEPKTRIKVREDLNGLTYLTEWLDIKIKENYYVNDLYSKSDITTTSQITKIHDNQLDLICEILKVLFNITLNVDKTSSDENEILYRRLTSVIRCLIVKFSDTDKLNEKEINALSSCVHVLTTVPIACLSELVTNVDSKSSNQQMGEKSTATCTIKSNKKEIIFENENVIAVEILLKFLKYLLDNREKKPTFNEQLPPILTVLLKCARCNSILRHYIRLIILPPLKDVTERPEVGNELRNHLCRFLTDIDNQIRDLAADLLFVCCKENVRRMVKYTGYGNAAGLFASRGILDCRQKENNEYSSDSEDSDTEEYKKMQHGINPVVGCYEAPKPNPMEGISEEQKEYEAMQLVHLMDKLQRQGIIQPCRINDDGKPQPVDHINQLQEDLPQQQLEQKHKI